MIAISAAAWCLCPAQETVTIDQLARHPRQFDGRLVRLHARLLFGWEGDNYLFDDPMVRVKGRRVPSMWLYCDAEHERQVFGANGLPVLRRTGVLGTFTGFFHFVPKNKRNWKKKLLFDPGPFQLETVSASDIVRR